MAITKESIEVAAETVKDFFKNFLSPNMKIEDVKEVAAFRFDEVIKKNEQKGLTFSAGKFHIKYVDDAHFKLDFEMYFKDDEDKWHKLANESDSRDMKLLEEGAAKTLKALNVIELPIERPKEPEVIVEEKKTPAEAVQEFADEKLDTFNKQVADSKKPDNTEF